MGNTRLEKFSAALYVVPAMLIIGIVIIYSVIQVFLGSFMTVTGGEEVFAGFRNYELLFKDNLFVTSIKNNFFLFLCVPVMTLLALVVAVILFDKMRFWKFYRSIIFVPFILAVPVVGVIFTYILQLNGVINTILRDVGLDAIALDWLGNPDIAIWSVGGVIIWKQFGFGVVLFLARLMSVDISLYEAAEVDGANWIQKFTNITIPMTASIIEFYVIISLIDMLSWVFSFVFVMTGGGPANSTTTLEFLIYKKSFAGGNYNYALAVSVFVLIIAIILIIIQQSISKRREIHE
ncbi:MAG TPA: sugar ABC transporter permease [Anaerovoracaceae bacterium]|nr:sugar ABC transporter permease [Anaerovoracaceae bacterium]